MKIWLCGLLALAFVPEGGGQAVFPSLGQTRPQVIAVLGHPSTVVSPTTNKVYTPSAHDRVLASSGNVIDSYYKTYSGIEFGIDILYELDNSESRLHPVERVSVVRIMPDKKLPLNVILPALPATKQLCRHGCKILLTIVYGVSYEAYIYPTTPLEEVSSKDDDSDSSSSGSVVALDVVLEGTPSSQYQLGVLDFNRYKVDLVTLCRVDLSFVQKNANQSSESDFLLSTQSHVR